MTLFKISDIRRYSIWKTSCRSMPAKKAHRMYRQRAHQTTQRGYQAGTHQQAARAILGSSQAVFRYRRIGASPRRRWNFSLASRARD